MPSGNPLVSILKTSTLKPQYSILNPQPSKLEYKPPILQQSLDPNCHLLLTLSMIEDNVHRQICGDVFAQPDGFDHFLVDDGLQDG
jgi:hypothetical protein